MACVYGKVKQFASSDYTSKDIEKIKSVGFNSTKEFENAIKSKDWVYLGTTEDAYNDIKKDPHPSYNTLPYYKFSEELEKGYGKSGFLEIRRCLVLSNDRVYYDNNYSD